ncbi:hypothetical protein PR048_001610 [Dryococelus australis]|uniref:BED-type domain-containing protein n=1 Tax=Dryococelus australis TaxID=614101 RepID=A0ABQ9IHZ0_9NEOP|nr:hypothetical protein PR048_001610 [Dryococelus australis]
MSRKNWYIVWDFFEKNSNSLFVTCQICKKKKNLENFGNFTNLKAHLTHTPNQLLTEVEEPTPQLPSQKELSVQQCFGTEPNTTAMSSAQCSAAPSSSTQLAHRKPVKRPRQLTLHGSTRRKEMSEAEHMDIDHLLVKMISTDFQPLSVVENEGFVNYSKNVEPRYSLPNRKVLSTKLLPEICSAQCIVAVTTDMWTSDSALSYLTVTMHFVSEFSETSLHSLVLNTVPMTDSHTGENIASSLEKVLCELNILHKTVGIVTDNEGHRNPEETTFILCCSHPQLVNDAINETDLAPILKKCRALVSHFKSSSTVTEKLRNMQRQIGARELKLKQDVSTRWNSCLLMLERLLVVKESLSAAISSLPHTP